MPKIDVDNCECDKKKTTRLRLVHGIMAVHWSYLENFTIDEIQDWFTRRVNPQAKVIKFFFPI